MKIEFTQAQLVLLSEALVELPYKKAAPLIAHINAQIQAQFDNAADTATPSGAVSPPDQFRGD